MRLLAPLGLAAILTGCTVTVELLPPAIANLENQTLYCTPTAGRDTKVDFRFSKTGAMTRLEVWVSTDDPGITDPRAAEAFDLEASFDGFDFGPATFVGFVWVDTDGDGRVTPARAAPQGIIIVPVDRPLRLWVRAFNGSATSGFVKGQVLLPEDAPLACDPEPAWALAVD